MIPAPVNHRLHLEILLILRGPAQSKGLGVTNKRIIMTCATRYHISTIRSFPVHTAVHSKLLESLRKHDVGTFCKQFLLGRIMRNVFWNYANLGNQRNKLSPLHVKDKFLDMITRSSKIELL